MGLSNQMKMAVVHKWFLQTPSLYRVFGPLIGFAAIGATIGQTIAKYSKPISSFDSIGLFAGAVVGCMLSLCLTFLDSRSSRN